MLITNHDKKGEEGGGKEGGRRRRQKRRRSEVRLSAQIAEAIEDALIERTEPSKKLTKGLTFYCWP